jgi:NAD(P)-dependent dehydrogenase (short-subunit alcohol dehydrogenase family)
MTGARDFEGMAALVTGGASGIGAAVAALLLARGARVAVLDRDTGGAPAGTLALRAPSSTIPARPPP